MIVYAIAVISVIALLVDYYIYRRIIRKHRFGKWMRVGYIVYALAVDLVIVSALIFYRNSLDRESPQLLHAVSWVFFLFFLNALPKLIYVLVSLPDLLVRRITHRTSHLFGYAGTALGLCVFAAMLWGGECRAQPDRGAAGRHHVSPHSGRFRRIPDRAVFLHTSRHADPQLQDTAPDR